MESAKTLNPSMGIKEFESFCRDRTIREVRLLRDMPGSLWVKFDYCGRQMCRYFEDTENNRRIIERLSRELSSNPCFPRPAALAS